MDTTSLDRDDSQQTADTIRSLVRTFCDEQVRPGARERDRESIFPGDLIAPMAEMGLFGSGIPQQYGGIDLDPWSFAAIMEELGAADSSVRSIVSVSVGLAGSSIVRWGTEQQKEHYLPKIAQGLLGAFGLTEPGAGSNPGELRTRAVFDNGGWVITGNKIFITNGTKGMVTLIFARAIRGNDDHGITCFLVPQDADGYRASQIHGKLGTRASDTAEIALEGVRVPEDAVLGELGGGMKVALSALDVGRLAIAASCIGVARESLEVSLTYATQREQFGEPIASRQLVQELLVDSHVDIQASRGLLEQVLVRKAAGERFTLEASTAKLFATEAAVRCTNRAVQVHGGYGYIDEYPVQRLMRDARVTTLYEGSTQVQKLLIGRALTGLSAF